MRWNGAREEGDVDALPSAAFRASGAAEDGQTAGVGGFLTELWSLPRIGQLVDAKSASAGPVASQNAVTGSGTPPFDGKNHTMTSAS